MKKAIALCALFVLVGCDKKEQPTTTATATAAAKPTAPATASAQPSAAAKPATPAPSASAAEEADEKEEQEGLEAGEVVVGYLQDLKDEGQCAALPAPKAEKAKYDEKKLEEMAKMMKAKVVKSCPTENIQGTCKTMGMLVNYYEPKYTAETAKKACAKNRGKFID